MEDHPEFQKATIETTVMPHPDVTDLTADPLEPQDPPEPQTPKRKEKAVQIEEPPVKVEPPCEPFDFRCCPLPPMAPPPAMIDVRDLSATLLGTFAVGAAVALALTYFSRPRVSIDA